MRINQLPSLEALLTFREVARQRSFTRAAMALSVTQGAVSHRIRGLEQHLGLSLFTRTTRKVDLTDSGRILAASCEEAFRVLDDGLRRLRPENEARVVVSCSPSFAIRWLVPHMPDLQAALPGIDVRIAADDRLATPGRDGVDLCLRYGPGGYADAHVHRLGLEQVTPVCTPAIAETLRTPADLAGQSLLHDAVLRGHPGRVGWTQWLKRAGVESVDPRKGTRFSHLYMALEAAQAGQGIALARGILVGRDLAAGRLIAPFDISVQSGLAYWVLTERGPLRPSVAGFRGWLIEAVALHERG